MQSVGIFQYEIFSREEYSGTIFSFGRNILVPFCPAVEVDFEENMQRLEHVQMPTPVPHDFEARVHLGRKGENEGQERKVR
jgi:hypothetical protein